MKRYYLVVALMLTTVAGGCGGGEEAVASGGAKPVGEAEDNSRVFFVAPQDGEMISVDLAVVFEFGSENLRIDAVPESVETVRPTLGHYHLGANTTCLPAGDIIPQGDLWIDLGDGSDTLEMFFEPGEYTFAVQAGDDEHRALDTPCDTISLTVEDGV